MPWLRVDDAMGEHRKVRRVLRAPGLRGLAALGLHTLGMLQASRYLTDGEVDGEFIEEAYDVGRVRPKDRDLADVLVAAGLWLPGQDGQWTIHDYLDYNPSRAQVEERRRKEAERKARGRGGVSA